MARTRKKKRAQSVKHMSKNKQKRFPRVWNESMERHWRSKHHENELSLHSFVKQKTPNQLTTKHSFELRAAWCDTHRQTLAAVVLCVGMVDLTWSHNGKSENPSVSAHDEEGAVCKWSSLAFFGGASTGSCSCRVVFGSGGSGNRAPPRLGKAGKSTPAAEGVLAIGPQSCVRTSGNMVGRESKLLA